MNNKPLTYIEEAIQHPILTSNGMGLGRDTKTFYRNMTEDKEEDLDWPKRQKSVKRCKDAAWRRWQQEYVTALGEKHNMHHYSKAVSIDMEDVVMIKGESKTRGKCKIDIISEVFQGKDDQIRGARVKTSVYYL